jgi:hypothetical protein
VPHIVSCIVSVAAVALTTATAGRLLGISLTAVTSALIAFSMPPVFSLRVANGGDLLMLVAQGVAGLFVAHTVRTRHSRKWLPDDPPQVSTLPLQQHRPAISEAILRAMDRDAGLRGRTSDLHVYVDQYVCPHVSISELDQMALDILRAAFGRSNVQCVSVYSGRQPGVVRIRVVAEYDLDPTLPRLRITGRSDGHCIALPTPGWPRGCTATCFDNGTEFIYQIQICGSTNPDRSS